MKKIFLFIIVLAISALHSNAQLKTIFKDDFSDNHNFWQLYDSEDFLVNIDKGKLHIEKLDKNRVNNGCLWYSKPISGFNTNHNFSISFKAKLISAKDVYKAIDLMWGTERTGANPCLTLYQVEFLTTGELKLNLYNNNVKQYWTYLFKQFMIDKDKGIPIAYNAYKVNNYEIVQQDSTCIIKINDREVFNKKIAPVSGNSIGMLQALKTSWEMDDLVIKQ